MNTSTAVGMLSLPSSAFSDHPSALKHEPFYAIYRACLSAPPSRRNPLMLPQPPILIGRFIINLRQLVDDDSQQSMDSPSRISDFHFKVSLSRVGNIGQDLDDSPDGDDSAEDIELSDVSDADYRFVALHRPRYFLLTTTSPGEAHHGLSRNIALSLHITGLYRYLYPEASNLCILVGLSCRSCMTVRHAHVHTLRSRSKEK